MKKTENFTKECSVLFIDDVEHVRELVEKMLKRLFKEVYLAEDGQKGLEAFERHKPDLIITDISMPVMDGLDMIEAIREKDIEQKIIVLSAHNDHSFFERAVNLKIDGYLIKPVNMDMLMKAVDNSVRLVVQKRELEALNKHLEQRVQEEVEKNRQKDAELLSTLTNFFETSPNPIIAYDGEKVSLVNRNFVTIAGCDKEALIGKVYDLDTLFEKRPGFVASLSELNQDNHQNRVSISAPSGRNIFILLENEVETLNNKKLRVYTFNNITINEYQKLKIRNYNERLEELIKALRRPVPIRIEETKKAEKAKKKPVTVEEKVPKEVRRLDEVENDILKKSHQGKEITSAEYTKEIDSYVLEEIQELTEIESEINEELMAFEENKAMQHIYNISERLLKYSSTMSLLFEFADLSYAVKSLSELLRGIAPDYDDEVKLRKIDLFLSNIIIDIANWRKTIFVDQDAKDIHYLDSSLFSAILQLELILNEDSGTVEGGDDLELF